MVTMAVVTNGSMTSMISAQHPVRKLSNGVPRYERGSVKFFIERRTLTRGHNTAQLLVVCAKDVHPRSITANQITTQLQNWMVIQRIILSANTEFLCDIIFMTSFLWLSNSYIIIMMLWDSHKITKTGTKFWIRIKRTDKSHRCPTHINYSKNNTEHFTSLRFSVNLKFHLIN